MSDGSKAVAGVYLAAGSSRRMGTAKQALPMPGVGGLRLGAVALRELLALRAELPHVVVVVRAADPLDWLPAEAQAEMAAGRCRLVVCPDAERGMAHSLRAGVAAAAELGAVGALVTLADQPFVSRALLCRLIEACGEGVDFAASGDGGVPKPPLVLGRAMWPAVAELTGDEGARSLLRRPEYVGRVLNVADPHTFMDVDTPELYEAAMGIFAGRR
ncbi:nucleotidyltransferase family protein [Paenibacillus whitsoniae]|uniref:Nucleotidyltransferase family protein n=1 Tax=Paenibacillus whitsoniae TaxID=2496558 RepID=A0A430JHW8_9BACL|nr:nucleotidyltransferase family protein [Paenibacillus whitsoniae]RTE10582.1 nucleotidyltransferase family protein [Paenibacillus whitsoniae]